MSKLMTSRRGRFAAALAALATTLLLVACGGGGGGTTPPPPPPTSPTITFTSSTPANGATGVTLDGTMNIITAYTNATTFDNTVAMNCNNQVYVAKGVLSDDKAGKLSMSLTYAGLPVNTTCTVAGNVTATGAGGTATLAISQSFTTLGVVCPSGYTPLGNQCVLQTLHYTDKVYTYWGGDGGYPQLTSLVDGSRVRAKNMTPFGTLIGCWSADKPQADGRTPHSCVDQVSGVRHDDLFTDPVSNELHQYLVAPTGVTWVKLTYDPTRIPVDHPDWTTMAITAQGQVFVRQDSTNVVRLLSTANVETTVINGDPATDVTCFLVMSLNN